MNRVYSNNQLPCFLTYLVKITITCPSILPSICSVLFSTRRIFLTTVPILAFRVEPFTSSDLVSTIVSPDCSTCPLASLCKSTLPSFSWSPVAFARPVFHHPGITYPIDQQPSFLSVIDSAFSRQLPAHPALHST